MKTVTHFINGEVREIPVNDDGSVCSDELRKHGNVPADRPLILKRSDGQNLLVNPGDRVKVSPGQHFSDAPHHVRGGRP